MRPLWRNFAGSMETLVPPPHGSAELWYDDRDVAFLRQDRKDLASITQVQAATISSLVSAGYKPDAAIQAVMADDLSLLKGQHTGLYSVQLQPPGLPGEPGGPALDSTQPAPSAPKPPAPNGNGKAPALPAPT